MFIFIGHCFAISGRSFNRRKKYDLLFKKTIGGDFNVKVPFLSLGNSQKYSCLFLGYFLKLVLSKNAC